MTDEVEPVYPRLSRQGAFDIASDLEGDIRAFGDYGAILRTMAEGLRTWDSDLSAALARLGSNLTDCMEIAIDKQERLFHGLHASHDQEKPS